jgi:pyridoxal phosphate enzyme (YggS family)
MNPFASSFQALQQQIAAAERSCARPPGSVRLLAVSKTQPAGNIRAMYELGQTAFGENYLQEALTKMEALDDLPLEWHFIGPVQSNKTSQVAAHFHWVHTLDRDRIAGRLNEQRPASLPPLNVCLQVNISGEASKSGVTLEDLPALLEAVAQLPRLRLRGLMTLPAPQTEPELQRLPFRHLAQLFETHRARYQLDTLSMGTTSDLQAAITEGATIVRVGTALFGARRG